MLPGKGGVANDHLIMIIHQGGGGRSSNDILIILRLKKNGWFAYIFSIFSKGVILFFLVIGISFSK